MPVSVLSAILCDEVRQEIDGNAIIVGARQSVGPPLPPEAVNIDRISFYLELATSYPPPSKIDVRFYHPNSETVVFYNTFENDYELPGDVQETEPLSGSVLLVANRASVEVPGAGRYLLQYRVDEGNWLDARPFGFPNIENKDD